eukprot:s284_g31.t1
MAAGEGAMEKDARLVEVTRALALADLAGLGQLVSEATVDAYVKSAGEALENRGNEALQAYGWLGEVPAGEKLSALVSWPIERAEETQQVVEKEWDGMWGKLPAMAQQHLDAASFKRAFLLNEGFELARKHLAKSKEVEGPPEKRPRPAAPPDNLPGLSSGQEFQSVQEILQNGRSANCLKAWVLVAEGSVQARKTTKGKPSSIYSCLVSDGQSDAVLTSWGEGAKVLHESLKGREGKQVTITQVGASNRNARMGIPELIAGRGVEVHAVAPSDEEKPLPRFTDMQRLAEVSDWSAVNVEGRVLEVLAGGHFKLVDESGLALRIHVDRPQIPKLLEGQSCQVLLATKSTRYSNVSVTGFSAVRPGEVAGPESVPLPSRVIFAL